MAKEYLPENEQPLNQLSKKALNELKAKPDDESLYLLQLLMWALRERREFFNRDNHPDLLDQVEYLELLQPKAALRYLLQEEPEGFALFHMRKDMNEFDPESLAVYLVNQLHHLMASSDTGYPPQKLQVVFPLT